MVFELCFEVVEHGARYSQCGTIHELQDVIRMCS